MEHRTHPTGSSKTAVAGAQAQPAESRQRQAAWLLTLLLAGLALALQGCDRGLDQSARTTPMMPGHPGTGNPTEVVEPHPGSITESPQIGGAREQVPAGITGSGGLTDHPTEHHGDGQMARQEGSGLTGGLGGDQPVNPHPQTGSTAVMGADAAREVPDASLSR